MDKLAITFLMLDGLLDTQEIFLIFQIVSFYSIEDLLLRLKCLESFRGEQIGQGFAFLEDFEAHLEVIHLEFDQIVD